MQYTELFENGITNKKQVSSKVRVSEKPLSYMKAKWLPAYLARLHDSIAFKRATNKTFGYFYNEYLELKSPQVSFWKTKLQANVALKYFGEKLEVSSITRFDVKKYINVLAKTGKHKDTIQSYFGKLNGILDLAFDAGVIKMNPCFGVKVNVKSVKNKEAKRPFEPWEVELLLSKATGELRNYLGIAFNTGMSPEEIIALMPQDLDFDMRTIKIQRVISKGLLSQETKTIYRTRVIPLFDSAKPYLLGQMALAVEKKVCFCFLMKMADG